VKKKQKKKKTPRRTPFLLQDFLKFFKSEKKNHALFPIQKF